jgi:hypothetical protein
MDKKIIVSSFFLVCSLSIIFVYQKYYTFAVLGSRKPLVVSQIVRPVPDAELYNHPALGHFDLSNGSSTSYIDVHARAGTSTVTIHGAALHTSISGKIKSGEMYVVANMYNNTVTYSHIKSEVDMNTPCMISFVFSNDKVIVETKNVESCDWDYGVDFKGAYTKNATSSLLMKKMDIFMASYSSTTLQSAIDQFSDDVFEYERVTPKDYIYSDEVNAFGIDKWGSCFGIEKGKCLDNL